MDKKPAPVTGRDRGAARPRPLAEPPPERFADVPRVSRAVRSYSQRISPRKELPCSLLLNTGSSFTIARAIHDISLVGAYVEIDPTGLAPGAIVELVMEFNTGRRNTTLQLSAEIVRIDGDGVALRFCSYGDRTYTELVNLLYTH